MGSQSSAVQRKSSRDRLSLTQKPDRNSLRSESSSRPSYTSSRGSRNSHLSNSSHSSSPPDKAKSTVAKKKRKKAYLIANRYVLGEQLGQGASALVRVATDNATGAVIAVKILDVRLKDRFGKRGAIDHEALKTIARGEGIWKRIGKHAHCVELLDAVLHKGCYYMVMERLGASLKDKMSVVHRETEAAFAHLFQDMLSGIQRVHEVGIVHRDVKPSNFLVKYADENTKHWSVKLCDFGHATYLPLDDAGLSKLAGTTPYMSPEMLDNRGYTEKTDIWSFGVTAYLMACREFPYWPSEASPKEEDIQQAIIDGRPKPRFVRAALENDRDDRARKPLSSDLIGFLQTVLQRNCHLRCRSDEALDNAFFLRSKARPVTAPASSSAREYKSEARSSINSAPASVVANVGANVSTDEAPTLQVQYESDAAGPTGSWSMMRMQEALDVDPCSPVSSQTIPRMSSRSGRSSGRSSSTSSSSRMTKSTQRNNASSRAGSHYGPLRIDSDETSASVSTDASPRSLGSLSEEVYQRPGPALTSGEVANSHHMISVVAV